MIKMIEFFTPGNPVPQGSKTYMGHGRMVEGNHKNLMNWRTSVGYGALNEMQGRFPSPVIDPIALTVTFYFMRPKAHYSANGLVKPNAPVFVQKPPDLDKLLRAVADALTGIVYRDDSQIFQCTVCKIWGNNPGVTISVSRAQEPIHKKSIKSKEETGV